jgi:pilus assembly protein CpaB
VKKLEKPQLIGLGVAVVAGIIAMMLAKNLIGSAPQPVIQQQQPKIITKTIAASKVLVVSADLRAGGVLTKRNMKWENWPTKATGGYITQKSKPNAMNELAGAMARVAFYKGDPVTVGKLVRAGDGSIMSSMLPAGMRAVAISISEKSAVGGFVLPNDRVDVISTSTSRNPNPKDKDSDNESPVQTLLTNVRVIAVGQSIDTKKGGKTAAGKTATLEVAENQVELLIAASSQGKLTLSLRSIADAKKSGNMPRIAIPPKKVAKKKKQVGVRIMRYGVQSGS